MTFVLSWFASLSMRFLLESWLPTKLVTRAAGAHPVLRASRPRERVPKIQKGGGDVFGQGLRDSSRCHICQPTRRLVSEDRLPVVAQPDRRQLRGEAHVDVGGDGKPADEELDAQREVLPPR